MIKEEFKDKKCIIEELKRVEKELFSEAIDIYYEELFNHKTREQELEEEVSNLRKKLKFLEKAKES